ncbi:caspase-8 [Cololabis saira]|uniref:caspase-8 n=1 Tax=Cololabis saira TaxID=129043 RepID=UPI002AD276C3|nr:caspase-8 [Cololabis saira]
MDFQKLLLRVSNALGSEEVRALAFLCTDLLNRNMNSVDSASDLFRLLMNQDHLSPEQPELLTDLLLTIQRQRLLRDVGLSDCECATSLISPYRKLLYSLSEEITADELNSMKFLLLKKLHRRKLEEKCTLEVFVEMENKELISETNLEELEGIFRSVCPVLNDKIKKFQALPVQETSRPRSVSCPSESNQASRVAGLSGLPELPLSSINSSNTSIDVTCFEERREDSVFHQKLAALGTETNIIKSSFQIYCHRNIEFKHLINVLIFHVDIQKETVTINNRAQENNVSPGKAEGVGTYTMTAAKRGTCVILNNYNFTTLGKRNGTEIDEKSLKNVFEWLDFEVQIHRDCKRDEMISVISELSKKDHSQADCVVCCVLSHGVDRGVKGVDGGIVTLKELTSPLDGLNCRSLVNKPKLFFIQACQGNLEQRSVESDSHEGSQISSDAKKMKSIPAEADFLLGMATVPFHVSFRDGKTGSWYIQSLCQNLVKMVPRSEDLLSILTKVNADVSEKYYNMKKQMPQPAYSLRKKVIFPVPKAPPPSLSN